MLTRDHDQGQCVRMRVMGACARALEHWPYQNHTDLTATCIHVAGRDRQPGSHRCCLVSLAGTRYDAWYVYMYASHTRRDKSEVSDGGVAGAGASDADLPAQSSKGSGLVEQSGAANGTSNVSSAPSQDSDSDSGSPRAKRRRSDSREPRKKHKRDKKSHAKKSKSSKGRDRSKERDERKKDKKKSAKDSKADRYVRLVLLSQQPTAPCTPTREAG